MAFLLIILKIILMFISNLGYWNLLKKSGINLYFIPLFAASCQIFLFFFAGLLNLLNLTAYALYAGGIVLFLLYLKREKLKALSEFLNPGYIISGVLLLTAAVILNGELFNNYDNFSHWALVVKEMLKSDRFPNFTNTIIEFKAYPLGSSSYIYYFAKCVGNAEFVQMLGQFCLELFAILPLFSLIKKHRALSCALLLLIVNYFFASGMYINDLSVDTLLPLFGMAMLFFVYKECFLRCLGGNADSANNGRFLIYSVPIITTVLTIKNSGIFFVAISELMFLIIAIKNKDLRKKAIGVMISPLLIYILWKRHCDYVFLDASGSMHAMTIQNYIIQLRSKTPADIMGICKSMAEFSVSGITMWMLLLTIISVGIMSFIYKRDLFPMFKRLFIIEILLYVAYMLGMLDMYIFSMPANSIQNLDGSDRYRMSIFTAMLYLLSIYTLYFISQLEKKKSFAVSFSVICLVFVAFWRLSCGGFDHFFTVTGSSQQRIWIQDRIDEYEVAQNGTYALCLPEDDYDYLTLVGRYLTDSKDFKSFEVKNDEDLKRLEEADYVFIMDSDNALIDGWVNENYPEQSGNEVIFTDADALSN